MRFILSTILHLSLNNIKSRSVYKLVPGQNNDHSITKLQAIDISDKLYIHKIVNNKESIQKRKKFMILSLDGGGIRGITTSVILEHIEKMTGKPIFQLFDLIAGTSTGGLLAGYLTVPGEDQNALYTAENIRDMYFAFGPKIFLEGRFSIYPFSPGYWNSPKSKLIKEYTGNNTLLDLLTDVLIPTFDMTNQLPYVFKSSEARLNSSKNREISVVLDATSAAPTFFYPAELEPENANSALSNRALVDGAIIANNPAMLAYAEALKNFNQTTEDLMILSIGTGDLIDGESNEKLRGYSKGRWGLWAARNFASFNTRLPEFELEQILKEEQYIRIQFDLENDYHAKIDNVKLDNMNWLSKKGDIIFENYRGKLERFFNLTG